MSVVEVDGILPQYMTKGAAGADLRAAFGYEIDPGQQVMIKTGTKVALKVGTAGLLLPRSSLCNKKGLQLVNSVGLLDEDYRGEIMFCYKNTGDKPIMINRHERIGQLVVIPYIKVEFIEVDSLDDTERGDGGFGSTNK